MEERLQSTYFHASAHCVALSRLLSAYARVARTNQLLARASKNKRDLVQGKKIAFYCILPSVLIWTHVPKLGSRV
jgi:hypothetical protein